MPKAFLLGVAPQWKRELTSRVVPDDGTGIISGPPGEFT